MNVKGIGTDLVEIARIQRALDRHGAAFAQRILTAKEYALFCSHKQPAQFLAGRFALKEAVVKALGCGFRTGVTWQQIEILNNELGQPQVVCDGVAKKQAGIATIHASLSHERAYAVAFVLAQN